MSQPVGRLAHGAGRRCQCQQDILGGTAEAKNLQDKGQLTHLSDGGHASNMGYRHTRVLQIVRTDATFEQVELRGQVVWCGKCIHCNARLCVGINGDIGAATVEHIVPLGLGGSDALENLALACRRCNHLKGKRLDVRRLDDPTLQAVILTLQGRRKARWRNSQ